MHNTNGLNTAGMSLSNKLTTEETRMYFFKSQIIISNQAYIAPRKKYDQKRDDCGRIKKI